MIEAEKILVEIHKVPNLFNNQISMNEIILSSIAKAVKEDEESDFIFGATGYRQIIQWEHFSRVLGKHFSIL